jgi:hypothetical protein
MLHSIKSWIKNVLLYYFRKIHVHLKMYFADLFQFLHVLCLRIQPFPIHAHETYCENVSCSEIFRVC